MQCPFVSRCVAGGAGVTGASTAIQWCSTPPVGSPCSCTPIFRRSGICRSLLISQTIHEGGRYACSCPPLCSVHQNRAFLQCLHVHAGFQHMATQFELDDAAVSLMNLHQTPKQQNCMLQCDKVPRRDMMPNRSSSRMLRAYLLPDACLMPCHKSARTLLTHMYSSGG